MLYESTDNMAIDSAKGDIFVPPPKYWNKRQKYITITDDMPDEQKDIAIAKIKK